MKCDEMRDLTEKQKTVLLSLLNGETRKEAAATAKVSEATVYRYLAEKGFQNALKEKRAEMFDSALNELYSLTVKANETLRRSLECGHAPTETRAAIAINTLALRAQDLEILNRLSRLEEILQAR